MLPASNGNIYLHALSDNGTAVITATVESTSGIPLAGTSAAEYNVGLVPSVWSFETFSYNFSANQEVTFRFGLFDLGGSTNQIFTSRPGVSTSVGFTVSDPSVIAIRANPITVIGPELGTLRATGLKVGTSTISINPVAGFAVDPARQNLSITVQ